jgi:hypothetical protein
MAEFVQGRIFEFHSPCRIKRIYTSIDVQSDDEENEILKEKLLSDTSLRVLHMINENLNNETRDLNDSTYIDIDGVQKVHLQVVKGGPEYFTNITTIELEEQRPPLTKDELKSLMDAIEEQYSDGIGEALKQFEIVPGYVLHLYTAGEDLDDENEWKVKLVSIDGTFLSYFQRRYLFE